MKTETIVYLASIADSFRVWAGMLGFAILIINVSILISRREFGRDGFLLERERRPFLWQAHIPLWVASVTLALAVALIPSGEDVYKIAGVSSQTKASIDASGKLIEEKTK